MLQSNSEPETYTITEWMDNMDKVYSILILSGVEMETKKIIKNS